MAKKMPLIISTLTLLIGSLATVPVWADDTAYSFDGPWSFDEMMAVENEIQPIIDEVCPYEWASENCTQRYTTDRYADAPIYGRVITFGSDQFHILSLDPNPSNGKTTIEYYFDPENLYEKYASTVKTDYDYYGNVLRKYFDPAMYTHTINKLHIYQTETGYFATSFDSPGVRLLYSGTKSEGEDSLLPVNQKGTLEIEEVSFDPQYRKWLYIDFEDEDGNIHQHRANFSDCHQGGELCKLYYNRAEPAALLINKPTYEEGYEDGYNAGLAAGQNAGYEAGFAEGTEAGRTEGYNEGANDGYTGGYNNGLNDGYMNGYNNGLNDGYMGGYNNGLNDGYMDGYNNGLDQGRLEGYEYGRTLGRDEGYTDGYNNGYDNGYNSGYNAANHNAENNDNPGDDTTDNESNTSVGDITNNNQAINGDISINNTSSISVGSELASSIKTRLSAKTPNTGSPTEENHSTELPWWLGAIFTLGALALIWLFVPNRKKSSKKS